MTTPLVITTNPNRIDLDEAYMQMAEIWAMRSKANRKQVGALIVKDRQIISDGYNGMPAGDEDDGCETVEWCSAGGWLSPEEIEEQWPHTGTYIDSSGNEMTGRYKLLTKPGVLHAESNALTKIAENGGVGARGATLYVTMSPCFECSKLIKQSKIAKVVYREQYRDTSGIDFLKSRGVEVVQLKEKA
jgi:dCMP deaminase